MGTISYNPDSDKADCHRIFRATSGGTVFSADLAGDTAFDYFEDTAVADDAIYFGFAPGTRQMPSNLYFNVGTAISATDIEVIWEYWRTSVGSRYTDWIETTSTAQGWYPIEDIEDDTEGFTVLGENVVKFPCPIGIFRGTINGYNGRWVRCRIVSVSGITEGGANTTDKVERNFGRVYVNDFTEGSPCTFMDIVEHLNTNYSYITNLKAGSCFYDFRKVGIDLNSPLETKNEVAEFGNPIGSWEQTWGNRFGTYLRAGDRIGETSGRNGSVFMLNGYVNSYAFQNQIGGKIYGSVLKSIDSSLSGYNSFGGGAGGECIDCTQEVHPSTFIEEFKGNVIRNGGIYIMAVNETTNNLDNRMILLNNSLGLLYNANAPDPQVFANWNYEMNDNTIGSFLTWTAASGGNIREFRNCTNAPLDNTKWGTLGYPRWVDGGAAYARWDLATNNCSNVFFYDSTADTYTDYTSESDPENANTIPLSGEVGDMIYINNVGKSQAGKELRFWIDEQDNDYEYILEEYYNGAWREWGNYQYHVNFAATRVIDKTENFTKSESLFLINTLPGTDQIINGVTGQWLRIRIVTKGTDTPVCYGIRIVKSLYYQDQYFNFKFSFKYKIIDELNNPLENARVLVKDKDGNVVYDELTDSDGLTSEELVLTDTVTYAPEEFDRTGIDPSDMRYLMDLVVENKSPFEIFITKDGYETYYQSKDIIEKQDELIPLKKALDTMIVLGEGVKIKADPTNSTKDREILLK
jgi:hypothetical protein